MKTSRIGIQGARGSACEAASSALAPEKAEFVYLFDGDRVLSALREAQIDAAIVVLESPLGEPVKETIEAISRFGPFQIERTQELEVRHVLLAKAGVSCEMIRKVASHAIPLKKHQRTLRALFETYEEVLFEDTGLAAEALAQGNLPEDAAVIAMPGAASAFGLFILPVELEANDGYLSKFGLLVK